MKKFRVKNLTVAVGANQELQRCGVNFSCPGGVGSVCGVSVVCQINTHICAGNSIHCANGSLINCGYQLTLNCAPVSLGCLVGSGGCGVNYSTRAPADFTDLVNEVPELTDKLDLIGIMKADLEVAVKNLDVMEKDLAKAARPQTVAEAKQVEESIEDALKEVKSLAKGLK